jgi:hypothetical protein
MALYRTTIRMPLGTYKSEFIEDLTGVGYVESVSPSKGTCVFEVEADDLYELAMTIRDLESDLSANYFDGFFEIPRPTKVRKR